MIYRIEISGNDIGPLEVRAEHDRNLQVFAVELAEKLGLDASRMCLDAARRDGEEPDGEEKIFRYSVTTGRGPGPCDEMISASFVKLCHVCENIGDEMTLWAGYDSLRIRLKGIIFG